MKRAQIIVVCIALLLSSQHCFAKVYIDLYSPFATRLAIAIPNFQNTGTQQDSAGISAKMPAVIAEDLNLSGFFRILNTSAIADNSSSLGLTASTIKWENLNMIGAEALVTGGFTLNGGELVAELRLFDTVQRQLIVGKRYFGKAQDSRLIAHKFSNEILKNLTGEESIFETKIAFEKGTRGNKEIALADFDGSRMETITSYNSITISPAWSPDGKKLAFTSYKDGNPSLYIKDIATGRTELVSNKKGVNITPAWSHDGRKIALTLSLNNGNSEIYLMDVASRALERLTDDWATDVSPTWSPDDTQIAFVSSRSGTPQIYVLDVATKKVRRITMEGSYNTSPDWSPKGNRIVYASQLGSGFNIFMVSTDGALFQQLTHRQGNNERPSWSPDGRFITFSSNRTGKKEIYIMRADGSGQKKITSGSGEKTAPAWSPFLR